MKTYTIEKTRKGRSRIVEGTFEELCGYFEYTLDCGKSWNSKINTKPKSIKSLVSNLQKSYNETEGACYERTFVKYIKKG